VPGLGWGGGCFPFRSPPPRPTRTILHFGDTALLFRLVHTATTTPAGAIINPIGAGDTVTAVLLSARVHGVPMPEAFATALAAGTASCMRLQGASFDIAVTRRLLEGAYVFFFLLLLLVFLVLLIVLSS
jgi:hypothetical protein